MQRPAGPGGDQQQQLALDMAEDLGEVVAGLGHRPDHVAAGVVQEAGVAVPGDRTQGRTLHGALQTDLGQWNT